MRELDMRLKSFLLAIAIGLTAKTVCAQSDKALPDPPGSPPSQTAPEEDTGDRGLGGLIPDDIAFVQDVVYTTSKSDTGQEIKLTFDAFFPKKSGDKPLPVFVYIHGGGYVMGSKDMGRGLCVAMARGGYFAATIRYRFAQESKLPAAADDVQQAIRFLRSNASELAIDPERIGVMGHSAGGHLCAYLGTASNDKDQVAEADVSCAVACVVDFFGPTDFEGLLTTPSDRMAVRLFGPLEAESMRSVMRSISPVHFVDAGDSPMLIIHGTEDDLVPIRQSELLFEKLQSAGVKAEFMKVEGAGHDNMNRDVYRQATKFLDDHLGGNASGVSGRRSEE
jgi:acetyl esterase/lipase